MTTPDHPIPLSHQIRTYTELKQQIHEDLRIQHPEWVEPTGECPECSEHEARLRELLDSLTRTEPNESPLFQAETKGSDLQMGPRASDKSRGAGRSERPSKLP